MKVQLKIERRRISTPSGHLPNFLDDLKSRRVDFSQRVQFFQLEGPNCTSNQSKDVLFYSYVRTTSHYSHYTLQLHCTRASGKSENLVGTISNTLQTQDFLVFTCLPCYHCRDPVFITENPGIIAGILFSLQGYPCLFPVLPCTGLQFTSVF